VSETVSSVDEPTGGSPLPLSEYAYRAIRDRLVMLDIRPGAPINEDRVAGSLGVGRTPVREALKRLETERLVIAYPRRGTFATDVNITDLTHLTEVRQVLEPVAAAGAARRASATDREALGEVLAKLEAGDADTGGPEVALRLDLEVHRAVYAASHNPYLEDTLVRYDNLATRIWCLFLDRLPGMAGHVNEHIPLLNAIIESDPSKAAELATAHVLGFEREIRELL
jgi:DNA-binding GntR family transcriptional regulator